MPEEASREASDSRDSLVTDGGGDDPRMAPWDETMHGSAAEEGDDEKSEDDSSGNVAGAFQPSTDIEPGSISLGNSLFVVAGAYIAVLSLTRLFIDVQGFDGRDVFVLTGGTLLISIVLLGFLGLFTPDT